MLFPKKVSKNNWMALVEIFRLKVRQFNSFFLCLHGLSQIFRELSYFLTLIPPKKDKKILQDSKRTRLNPPTKQIKKGKEAEDHCEDSDDC